MHHRDTAFYRYHQHTKHTLEKLHADRWFLDWDTQPNPFRHYAGAPLVPLPVPRVPRACGYFDLADVEHGPAVSLERISQLLYDSMAIATWKEVPGKNLRWALRVNPSSGNLHPTETHLIARGVEGLDDGCYHFRVDDYALEARSLGPVEDLAALFHRHCGLPAAPLTVLLTTIFWREAWKYRDRAFRYCHHDLGHALAAITEAARGLGYPVAYRHLFDDATIVAALGLTDGDEVPGVLLAIGNPTPTPGAVGPEGGRRFVGTPNPLSGETITYDSITEVYAASCTPTEGGDTSLRRIEYQTENRVELPRTVSTSKSFWAVVRTRRSGVDFDGQTGTDLATVGAILARATRGAWGDLFNTPDGPRHDPDSPPDRRGRLPLIHLYLYVHRVEGLPPGVYYYERERHRLVPLALRDVRRDAAYLSLQQTIAGNGAFAISMIADLASAHAIHGERGYRAAHIEAGFIGQGLYLGAETAGLNATGIGAFFDDDVNRYLQLPDGFEVIYHFTIGRSVPDPRLADRPAYAFTPRSDACQPTSESADTREICARKVQVASSTRPRRREGIDRPKSLSR